MTRLLLQPDIPSRNRGKTSATPALGYGGISYIVALMGCHAHTVRRGMEELTDEQAMSDERIR